MSTEGNGADEEAGVPEVAEEAGWGSVWRKGGLGGAYSLQLPDRRVKSGEVWALLPGDKQQDKRKRL